MAAKGKGSFGGKKAAPFAKGEDERKEALKPPEEPESDNRGESP
jgi:hypothetical protein